MKIALFTDTYMPQTNGVVACIHDTIGALSERNEILLFAPGQGPMRTQRVSRNFRIYWVPSIPFPFYEGYRIASIDYRRISAIMREERPDIVHAHAPINLGLQGMISARRKGIPTVATYHTHFPDYVPHLLNGLLPAGLRSVGEFTARKFVKHTYRHADVVTAPTMELVQELRSYGLRNVERLPNGISMGKLDCSQGETRAFRKRHGLEKGKKVVLYLGRISFEKRVDVLLEAFSMMERKDAMLVIAGGGPYLGNFRDLAASMGLRGVVFTGFVDERELGAAYSAADIFASASDSETFGLTFVEAMHAGLPVVGVSRLGPKEIIRHGRTGLLVEPGNPSALASAMDRLLSDAALRRRMGKAGRLASERYTIEASAEKTMRLYRRLLRVKGSTR
jgi:glycosyltransferase involved in cell wall biosynthesis